MAIIMGLVVCEAGEGRGGENTGKGAVEMKGNSSRAATARGARKQKQKQKQAGRQAGKQRNSSGRSKRGFTLSVEQGCGQKVCGAVGGCHGGEVANL